MRPPLSLLVEISVSTVLRVSLFGDAPLASSHRVSPGRTKWVQTGVGGRCWVAATWVAPNPSSAPTSARPIRSLRIRTPVREPTERVFDLSRPEQVFDLGSLRCYRPAGSGDRRARHGRPHRAA